MNRFRVSVVSAVLFLVVTATFVLMAPHKSAAQNPNSGPDVHIVSPLPLPVTGTLSFATGSAVTVNNPESSPVLVQDMGRGTPFQSYATSLGQFVSFGPPPAGHRWIIEHVSATGTGATFDETFFTLLTYQPNPVFDYLISQKVSPTSVLTNSQTKLIVEPGQSVWVQLNGQVGGTPRISAFISGVIVPAP